MFSFKGSASAASLLALSVTAVSFTGLVSIAQADDLTFQGPADGSASDEDLDWSVADNWSSGTVAGPDDNVVVEPDAFSRGAVVTDERTVKSLELKAGLLVKSGGDLTVTDELTNNANSSYFINEGIVTVTGGVNNNNYISNSSEFHGALTNGSNGVIYSQSAEGSDVVATWSGDVIENNGFIQSGGVWNGDVIANHGSIVSHGVWNGSIDNKSGSLDELSGVVNGDVTHSGTAFGVSGVLTINGNLIINNTGFGMENDVSTDTVLRAHSWSGSGIASFDLSTSLGRADRIELSEDYTADTSFSFNLIGPSERVLGDITLVSVDGANTGTATAQNLPEDGVISYHLERSGNDWILATSLSKAPEHVAAAVELIGRTLADAERVPLAHGDDCATGGWARALGSTYDSTVGDVDSQLDFGGGQVGYDVSCSSIGQGGTLGIGITAGGVFGQIDQDFGKDGDLDGDFQQGFVGLYADFARGPLRAILQGQFGLSSLSPSDRQTGLDEATLTTARYDISGSASYAFAFGGLSIAPELGFAASGSKSNSDNFADVGTMDLAIGPELDVYLGATFTGNLALSNGATSFAPFASVALHDDLLSSSTAVFTDSAGGTADIPIEALGTYVALGVGFDVLQIPVMSGKGLDAGLQADFKLGDNVTESSVSGYARMRF